MRARQLAWKQRLGLALASLALLAGACLGFSALQQQQGTGQPGGVYSSGSQVFDSGGASARNISEDPEALVFSLFGSVAKTTDCYWERLPEGFDAQVFDSSRLNCSMRICSGNTVGFVSEGSARESFDTIDALLRDAGWTQANRQEGSTAATYVKSSGSYRWLYLSCSEVAGSVSCWLLLQPQREGEQ